MTTVQNEGTPVVYPWTFNTVDEWVVIAKANGVSDVGKIAKYANSWMGYLPKIMAKENDLESYQRTKIFQDTHFKDKDWFYKTLYLSLCSDLGYTFDIYTLIEDILELTVYDDSILEDILNYPIIPVLESIATRQTFKFIDDPKGYRDYVTTVNLGSIINLLNWSGSIRGAWFCVSDHMFKYKPFINQDYVIKDSYEINGFIVALICFYKETVALTKEIIEKFGEDIKLNA